MAYCISVIVMSGLHSAASRLENELCAFLNLLDGMHISCDFHLHALSDRREGHVRHALRLSVWFPVKKKELIFFPFRFSDDVQSL